MRALIRFARFDKSLDARVLQQGAGLSGFRYQTEFLQRSQTQSERAELGEGDDAYAEDVSAGFQSITRDVVGQALATCWTRVLELAVVGLLRGRCGRRGCCTVAGLFCRVKLDRRQALEASLRQKGQAVSMCSLFIGGHLRGQRLT